MKRIYLAAAFCAALFFACDQQQEAGENKAEGTDISRSTDNMDNIQGEHEDQEITSGNENKRTVGDEIDFMKPEAVVNALINASKANDYNKIQTLCDADAKNTANTICNAGGQEQALMQKLATATINGDINVKGEFATVPIKYGNSNTMDMVKLSLRKDKWFISNIEQYKPGHQ